MTNKPLEKPLRCSYPPLLTGTRQKGFECHTKNKSLLTIDCREIHSRTYWYLRQHGEGASIASTKMQSEDWKIKVLNEYHDVTRNVSFVETTCVLTVSNHFMLKSEYIGHVLIVVIENVRTAACVLLHVR